MTVRHILAAALALLLLNGCRSERATTARDAPVIIVSIDTLRADHLPAYGYAEGSTPAIDAFRADSILFSDAYSNVPLTFPSHVSLLTGLLPPQHGVRNNIGYSLNKELPTLPKALKAIGYETGAAISSYVLRGNTGISSSFDFYDDAIVSRANVPVGSLQRQGDITADVASKWIAERKEKPFFFMLHLFEPHSPYEPAPEFRTRFAHPYDGEIATVDAIFARFIERLKAEGIYDRAVIILLSDHGEGLHQHGEPEHGIFLYREAIHVPLIVKLPESKRAGESSDRLVSLTEIFPTIAQLTGAALPPNVALASILDTEAKDAPQRSVYSETLYPRIHLGWSELRSLVSGGYQFIQAPRPELYDLRRDPRQTTNILANERRTYARMRDELAKFGTEVTLPTNIDPEEAKKLAALGYLGSAAPATGGPLPDPKDKIGDVAGMMKAMQLARDARHDEAIAEFRRIVAANPRFTDAWNQLGTSLETLGRLEEAAQAYRSAIEKSPELGGEFGLKLGSVYLKLERFEDAEKHALLGEKTNFGGSHILLARIALAQKDYAKAEKEARTAEKDAFSSIPARVLLAQIHAQQERPAEALRLIEQVSAEAEARRLGAVESLEFVRGDALARLGRNDEAVAAFEKEIATFPAHRQAYSSLYLVHMLAGRPIDANKALVRMVEANRTKSAALFAASTVEAVGDTRGAAEWRRRATALP